ncbi:hypothetical protein [Streptomyces sp. NPDC002851]
MPNQVPAPSGAFATLAATSRTVCGCGGPLIVPGLAVVITGALLGSVWLLAIGALVMGIAAGRALRCHRRRRLGLAGPDDCCPNSTVRRDETTATARAR